MAESVSTSAESSSPPSEGSNNSKSSPPKKSVSNTAEGISAQLLDPYQNFGTDDLDSARARSCICGFPVHMSTYDEKAPIFTKSGVDPGSYEETLACAKALCGDWVTLLDRSHSLDSQMKHVGVNMFKRAIMNRLAVPLKLFLEKEDKVLHVHILTPIGTRHMVCDLTGGPFVDEDPDAGKWNGTAKMIDYSIPWFCGGRPVRALQQVRKNEKAGWSVETRCVLPDAEHGYVMLFNFTMISRENPPLKRMFADRVLKRTA